MELSKGEVREWSRAILRRSHYTANRAFEVLRRAYTWGLGEDLVVTTPVLGLSKPGTEHESERVLSIEEISAVLFSGFPSDAIHANGGGCRCN